MKNVIIIGARGTGREIFMQYRNSCVDNDVYVKGFLDDDPTLLDGFNDYPPILGPVETYEIQPNDYFICALGDPFYRKKYVDIILSKGGEFTSCISNKSYIQEHVKIGKGVFVGPFNYIDTDVTVDDFTLILSFCNIGHDTKIGKFNEIEPFSAIAGNVTIGEGTTLHTRSTIGPRLKIGHDVVVGAGSVVLRDVEPYKIVFGNPARVIKENKNV